MAGFFFDLHVVPAQAGIQFLRYATNLGPCLRRGDGGLRRGDGGSRRDAGAPLLLMHTKVPLSNPNLHA